MLAVDNRYTPFVYVRRKEITKTANLRWFLLDNSGEIGGALGVGSRV